MPHGLDITLHFQFRSAIHITGERAQLWTDKAMLLDWRGQHAVIPATSIKGWLRDHVERTLRGLGREVCDSSDASSLCGRCITCQLFGSPRHRALLRFSDVLLHDDLRDIRMNVSLSRYRRASYEERLFSTELAWTPEFACKVDGILNDRQFAETAAALVYLGARVGFALGGARSRGLGWVSLAKYEARIDRQLLSDHDLNSYLQQLVGQPQGT